MFPLNVVTFAPQKGAITRSSAVASVYMIARHPPPFPHPMV